MVNLAVAVAGLCRPAGVRAGADKTDAHAAAAPPAAPGAAAQAG
ncbi:MAG: hypothetical protein ACRD1M_10495 [Terriglobales bacterium]